MNTPHISTGAHRVTPRIVALSAALDVILVVVFTAIGRGSHAREATFSGLLQTSWPFLVALILTWLVCRVWRHPLPLVRAGIPIWVGTVALGLCIRVWVTENTAALPFIIVTVLTLGLFLLGWRLVALLLSSLARKRPTTPPVSREN